MLHVPAAPQAVAKSDHVKRKLAKRQTDRVLDPLLDEQVASGRFIACISSRPGQVHTAQSLCCDRWPGNMPVSCSAVAC